MTNNNRQYYPLLDAFRFLAAFVVIGYHLFEAVAFAAGAEHQNMFHGFLAVDFFLILSGFVMSQAYDSQWETMTVGAFFRKRLVRLHPMVVLGVLIGLLMFLFEGRLMWDGTQVGWGRLALATLLALFLIPSPLKLDVRGNTEMFPLNGPHWSLFFEYIGNIIYALLLRKLSTAALRYWVSVSFALLLSIGLFGPDGSIAYGWSSQPVNMLGGFLRMNFAYSTGLLLARLYREKQPSKRSGWEACLMALVLVVLFAVPYIGSVWGVLYQLFCVAIAFPLIIWYVARTGIAEPRHGICKTLGGMSYTLYAIHYPFIYLYIDWINAGRHPFGEAWWTTPLVIALTCVVLSWLCYRFYDKPIRKLFSK